MSNAKTRNRTKGIVVGALAVGLLGLGVASAANLGVQANNELGAGTSVSASCQPAGTGSDISVGFSAPTYVAASRSFSVDTVKLGNIAGACNTKPYKLVVANAAGATLAEKTGVVAGPAMNVALPSAVDSASVGSVSLVIYGD